MRRLVINILYPVAKIYWFLFRPKTQGTKCVIKFGDEILMVRHTYGNSDTWTFPGGGVKKGETPEEAVLREINEEVEIKVADIKKVGSFLTTKEYKRDTVYCFSAEAQNRSFNIGPDEIAEARWFLKNNLPENMLSGAKKVYSLCISNSRE
jgi:NADH pyrophosphatase NudC (nudix superfamily)